MKTSTKEMTKGKFHQAKGKAKEKIGKVTGNPGLEIEGQDEHDIGKVQEKIGQVVRVFEK